MLKAPMTEEQWSELSREAGDRFDLSLWKKGGMCCFCDRPAVYAKSMATKKAHRFQIGRYLVVCKQQGLSGDCEERNDG